MNKIPATQAAHGSPWQGLLISWIALLPASCIGEGRPTRLAQALFLTQAPDKWPIIIASTVTLSQWKSLLCTPPIHFP
jgi:hypothetical protein